MSPNKAKWWKSKLQSYSRLIGIKIEWFGKNNSEGNLSFGHSKFWIFLSVPTVVTCTWISDLFHLFWEKLNKKNFCLKNGRWEFINSSDFRRATIGWWKQLWSQDRFWTSKILHFLECSSSIVTCTWTSDLSHLFLRKTKYIEETSNDKLTITLSIIAC